MKVRLIVDATKAFVTALKGVPEADRLKAWREARDLDQLELDFDTERGTVTGAEHVDPVSHLQGFDQHMLLIAAARYFIGRQTAAAGCFAESLAQAWPDIPQVTRSVVRQDLEEAFAQDDIDRANNVTRSSPHGCRALGSQADRWYWEKVREAWKKNDAVKERAP